MAMQGPAQAQYEQAFTDLISYLNPKSPVKKHTHEYHLKTLSMENINILFAILNSTTQQRVSIVGTMALEFEQDKHLTISILAMDDKSAALLEKWIKKSKFHSVQLDIQNISGIAAMSIFHAVAENPHTQKISLKMGEQCAYDLNMLRGFLGLPQPEVQSSIDKDIDEMEKQLEDFMSSAATTAASWFDSGRTFLNLHSGQAWASLRSLVDLDEQPEVRRSPSSPKLNS